LLAQAPKGGFGALSLFDRNAQNHAEYREQKRREEERQREERRTDRMKMCLLRKSF